MTKIKVELEVPENCKFCSMFDYEYNVCNLFNRFIPYDEEANIYTRCDECKQKEVQNEQT